NEITGGATPASFEPTIDYVVTKIPRFAFEKFEQADAKLSTQMKSVGEVMAIGRTFQESLQKALRGLEVGSCGFEPQVDLNEPEIITSLRKYISEPGAERIWFLADGFRAGMSLEEIHQLSSIDPWFLIQIEELVKLEEYVSEGTLNAIDADEMFALKQKGFSDKRLGQLLGNTEAEVRAYRKQLGINPVYKRVDTCAAEFATSTAYMYSTYEQECEAQPSDRKKILVLGGGPNRIGQG
ncbi:MAG: carbamoyl phosphate synthase large subunit, partial [Pseudomonadales bacterium]